MLRCWKKLLALGLYLTLLLFASGCQTAEEPLSVTSFQFNTVVTLTIYDSHEEALLEECLALCDKYEAIFSRTRPDSEIYQLNQWSQRGAVGSFSLSEEAAELIAAGLSYGELSDGALDITIGPVSALWDFTAEDPEPPSQEAVRQALLLVNYRDVTLRGNQLSFAKAGMEVDLGAIAKGYVADRIKDYLLSKGVKSAIINLGGNVLCIGERTDKTPFTVGIQKPFAQRQETIRTLSVSDQSVVSSGVYERYFEKDGRLYHHILDPATGFPCENNLSAISILSETSLEGDCLSTACFVLGPEKGRELLENLSDTCGLFITNDGKPHETNDFPQ